MPGDQLLTFVVRRLLWAIALVPLVMLLTFALMRGAGGTPFRPPEGYGALPLPLRQLVTDFYRLDEPWFVEFAIYVRNVFTFDFGPSLIHRVTVTEIIQSSFPVTLQLVLLAALVAVPAGVALGTYAAVRRGGLADLVATSVASVFLVVPVFFVAYVLARWSIYEWKLVEPGWEGWESKVLPTLTLALVPTGYVARLIRGAVVETLQEDYVRTARAKGLLRERVLLVHVVRNSLVPFLSAAIPMLALLVTGAFFVEGAFEIPGASSFFVEAALTRDYPLLLGLTVVLAVVVIGANLLADVLLAVLDPRIREGAAG